MSNDQVKKVTPDNIEQHRKLLCVNYNQCMDRADQKGWAGFSCNSCPSFGACSPERRTMDHIGLIALAQVIIDELSLE